MNYRLSAYPRQILTKGGFRLKGFKMNNSGIYMITNVVNNKRYIGQSKNISNRKIHHFSRLRGNAHYNKYLQKAFNKYGENNFIFSVLLYCELFELTKYEQFFVDFFDPEYNILKNCVDSWSGVKRSKEARKKCRNTFKMKYILKLENEIKKNIISSKSNILFIDDNGNIKSRNDISAWDIKRVS